MKKLNIKKIKKNILKLLSILMLALIYDAIFLYAFFK